MKSRSIMVLFILTLFITLIIGSCVIKKTENPVEPAIIDSPSSITSSQGEYTDRIAVTWAKVLGAEHYYIYRSTVSTGNWTRIKKTAQNYYEDTSVQVDTNYYYKVKAYSDAAGLSPSSPVAMGYLDPDALSAPGNIQATNGTYDDKVEIVWDEVDGAELYYVYRATEAYTFTELNTTDSTSYSDTTAVVDTDYYYRVKAWRSIEPQWSGSSDPDLGYLKVYDALTAPANVLATNGTYDDKVNIAWDSVDGAELYYVYRATEAYNFTQLTSTVSTSYSDTSAVSGTDYYYRVKAWRSTEPQWSGSSDPDLGYLKVYDPLPAPSVIQASDGETYIMITWNSVPEAEGYILYRSSADMNFTALTPPISNDTPYIDSVTTPGVEYYYRVRSWRSAAPQLSEPSYWDVGYKSLEAASPPTLLSVSKGEYREINLTWTPVTGADHYKVYRSLEKFRNYTYFQTVTSTGFSYSNPDYGYYFKVSAASDKFGETGLSNRRRGYPRNHTFIWSLDETDIRDVQIDDNEVLVTKYPPFIKAYDYDKGSLYTAVLQDGSGNSLSFVDSFVIDSAGNRFVMDPFLKKVFKYDPNYVPISNFGSPGSGPGQFDQPAAIAIDPDDNVYIADNGNDNIQKFDSAGNYISQIGYGTNLSFVGDMDYHEGYLYITDYVQDKLVIFSTSGQVIRTINQTLPAGVKVVDSGRIYVSGSQFFLELDESGNIISGFDATIPGDYRIELGYRIAVDDYGDIYILDASAEKLKKYTSK